jgi:hypothetical protein
VKKKEGQQASMQKKHEGTKEGKPQLDNKTTRVEDKP